MLALLLPIVLSGCYASHRRSSPADAGEEGGLQRDGGGQFDGSVRDGDVPDAGRPPDDASADGGGGDCPRVAWFRRCDAVCPVPCTAVDGPCYDHIGVCRLRESVGRADRCVFGPSVGAFTFSGNPCAAWEGDGSEDDAFEGVGMPVEFCLEARDAGLPPFECVYSDGTRVVSGPPSGACPSSSDPRSPFCGGPCGSGEVLCPDDRSGGPGACVGVSDIRGHGVCAGDIVVASPRVDASSRSTFLEWCAGRVGGECVYLILRPQAFPVDYEIGYPVLRDACTRYHALFPDSTACVDADWNEVR